MHILVRVRKSPPVGESPVYPSTEDSEWRSKRISASIRHVDLYMEPDVRSVRLVGEVLLADLESEILKARDCRTGRPNEDLDTILGRFARDTSLLLVAVRASVAATKRTG